MFKKIFSIFLVCLMCLSLSIPAAFAACNVEPNHSYTLDCEGLNKQDKEILYYNGRPITYAFLRDNPGFSLRVSTNSTQPIQISYGSYNIHYGECEYVLCASFLEPWGSYVGRENEPIAVSNLGPSTLTISDVVVPENVVYNSTPELPDDVSGSDYALWYENGTLFLLTDFVPSDSRVEAYDDAYRVLFNISEPTPLYSYSNASGSWVRLSDMSAGAGLFSVVDSGSILHYPDKLTYEGKDFFTGPLTLEMAVQGGLVHLMGTIMKAVLILVGLGLSLMASLICLELLKRLFYQFLN